MVNWMPERTAEELDALRENIRELGVLEPILVDANTDEIIDGNTRLLLAGELGIECPRAYVSPKSDDERLVYALSTNVMHRKLTKTSLGHLIDLCRAETDWSNSKIATVLGVPEPTVRRRPATSSNDEVAGRSSKPPRTIGRDGKKRPSRRATSAEVAQRGLAVVKLWHDGYTRAAICDALGIAERTLSADLSGAGIDARVTRRPEIKQGAAPAIMWRAQPTGQKPTRKRKPKPEPHPEPPVPAALDETPGYTRSLALISIAAMDIELHQMNAENRLAHNAGEAADESDEAWFSEARATIGKLIARLEVLQRILDDPAERTRRQRMQNEFPDAEPTYLRAVES